MKYYLTYRKTLYHAEQLYQCGINFQVENLIELTYSTLILLPSGALPAISSMGIAVIM